MNTSKANAPRNGTRSARDWPHDDALDAPALPQRRVSFAGALVLKTQARHVALLNFGKEKPPEHG